MAQLEITAGSTFGLNRQNLRDMFAELYASDIASSSLDLSGTLDVTGATTLDSTLDVVGATTVGSTLEVTGEMTTIAGLDIGTTLDVTGAVTCDAGLTVAGASVIMSALPTDDPAVAGQLWADSGVVTVSSGA